jgi:hypothetical protein
VIITSLVANANNGENATYSITLTGTGRLGKVGNTSNSTNTGENTGGNTGGNGSIIDGTDEG